MMSVTMIAIIPVADPASLELYATLADALLDSPALEGRTEAEFAGATTVRFSWNGMDFIFARKRIRTAA